MILYAAETDLGYFGFDRTVYGNKKNTVTRKWWWLEELRQEREKDIRIEMMEGQYPLYFITCSSKGILLANNPHYSLQY